MKSTEQLFNEAIEVSKELGKNKSYSFVVETYEILSGLKTEDAKDKLHDYLFSKFNRSGEHSFNEFVSKLINEEGIQIKADIPIHPEKPVDEELREAEEVSEEPNKIDEFLTTIGLKDLDESQADSFIFRFKDTLSSYIDDEEVLTAISYLLYKATFESDQLSDGETEELNQLIDAFTTQPEAQEQSNLSEAKGNDESKNKKIGIITTLVAGTLLFGIGGLLAGGLFLALSGLSNDDYKKSKEDIESDDFVEEVKKGKVPKEKVEEIKDKPQVDSKEIEKPKNLFQALKQDFEKIKDNLKNKAKSTVEKINQKSVDVYDKAKDVIAHPVETAKKVGAAAKSGIDKVKKATDFGDITSDAIGDLDLKQADKTKKANTKRDKEDDAKKLKPDDYKKKWGKCPAGWIWDKKKKACVQTKLESIQENYSTPLINILL